MVPNEGNEDLHLNNQTMFMIKNSEGLGYKVDYLDHDGDLDGLR